MSAKYPGEILSLRTDRGFCKKTNQVYLEVYPDFQRDFQFWPEKMRTAFIESILLDRIMNPIWTVFDEEKNQEEVLDGMHRLGHYLRFLEGRFLFRGKLFSEMDRDLQQKIRNYGFSFNRLDSSYKKDPEKLFFQYQILNRSSIPLNKFEVYKPILQSFYEVLDEFVERFIGTLMFKHKTSKRGKAQWELCKFLALSEKKVSAFSSFENLAETWIETHITFNASKIYENVQRLKEMICLRLNQIADLNLQCERLSLFNKGGSNTIDTHNRIAVQMIICRIVAHYGSSSDQQLLNLKDPIATEILPLLENNPNRNGSFYLKLLCKMDEVLGFLSA